MIQLNMRQYQTEDDYDYDYDYDDDYDYDYDYDDDYDYWRIRAFLREVFTLNGRRELSWHVARLDYWRWHGIYNLGDGELDKDVFIWEAEERIAAVLNRESAGQAFLQIHPSFKTAELEDEMIALAEDRLCVPSQRGGLVLWVWADSQDTLRHEILTRRGYSRVDSAVERQWRRDLDLPIPAAPAVEGYTVRSLGDIGELAARCKASRRSFHPDEPDDEGDNWAWYLNIQSAPLYRRDLDIVAATAAGEIAAFTTIWYDDVTRSAYFEPVGTAIEHQRRGLGKAVMLEGLRRLKRMGATRAFVGGYEPPANALYQSVMGVDYDLSEQWVKRW